MIALAVSSVPLACCAAMVPRAASMVGLTDLA